MSRLDGIYIEGFKSIAHTILRLRPLNVLIGANGSGKSNFIEAISFLRTIVQGQLQRYVKRAGGADRIVYFGSKATSKLEMQVSFDGGKAGYGIELRRDDSDGLYVNAMGYNPSGLLDKKTQQEGVAETGDYLLLPEHIRRHIESWQHYHFHDAGSMSPMKTTADVNDNRYLRPDGSNLAAFLFFLRGRHGGSYTQILRTIQLAAPFFDDFALEPLALNEDKIRLEWQHSGSDAYFDASSLSDGTLRFIALATLLLQPASLRPSVVLLDEPELGLHPYAITLLSSMLKQASVESQIIVATQSPVLLDHFEPKDVLVANRVNGATTIRRLDDEDLATWLEEYSLGQLWEKNEIGGRPSPEDTGPESLP